MNDPKRHLQAILRNDLASFIRKTFAEINGNRAYQDNWHIHAIAHHLQQCIDGKIKRLIITMPPRNLKSIAASVAFPAFVLGHRPEAEIVTVSYSNELSGKHANDCRAVMSSEWYHDIFRQTRIMQNREHDILTYQRGGRLSTSVGGTLTGRGGDFIIIDDPIKPDNASSETQRQNVIEWYNNTLYSRQNDKKDACIIIIMQRVHMDDLVGHVLDKEEWTHLNLAAIAEEDETIAIGPNRYHHRKAGDVLHPEREGLAELNNIKSTMGSYHFSSQYQQCPVPFDGQILKLKWFQIYNTLPEKQGGDQVVQSWDTASKSGELNDYSVCTTWLKSDNQFYLLNVYRERLEFPDLKRKLEELASAYQPDAILIEDKGSGTGLIQEYVRTDLRDLRNIIPIIPESDKITRASTISHIVEAGNVFLPTKAYWLDDFISETKAFPNGRHDDQIDSFSQFLNWANTKEEIIVRVR